MKIKMIMLKVKIKFLLLLIYLVVGILFFYVVEILQVWICVSNDFKNIYKIEVEIFEKKIGIKIEYFNVIIDFEQCLV